MNKSMLFGLIGIVGCGGAAGAPGINGTDGVNGTDGINGEAGANGAMGAMGATGATGSTGAMGATGTTGATGAMGATGLPGMNGATGAEGPQGAMGYPGDAGGTKITGSIGCFGTLSGGVLGTGVYNASYTADVFADGSIFAQGSVGGADISASSSVLYAATQVGAETAAVNFTFDVYPPADGGWWQVSFDKGAGPNGGAQFVYNDTDITNCTEECVWVFNSCTVNLY